MIIFSLSMQENCLSPLLSHFLQFRIEFYNVLLIKSYLYRKITSRRGMLGILFVTLYRSVASIYQTRTPSYSSWMSFGTPRRIRSAADARHTVASRKNIVSYDNKDIIDNNKIKDQDFHKNKFSINNCLNTQCIVLYKNVNFLQTFIIGHQHLSKSSWLLKMNVWFKFRNSKRLMILIP